MIDLKGRFSTALCLVVTIVVGILIRCLHLIPGTHYFILSADSYFFHWEARQILIGQPIPMHSGLAYPLAYSAKFISLITPLPLSDALDFASKLWPLILFAISAMVIYLAASRIYNRGVGLLAAFTLAFLPHAYWNQAAGYIDRDGANTLLIMLGAFAFYFFKGWQWKIGKLDVGWLAAGVLVAGIGQLIFIEWVWVGRWLLLAVLATFFAAILIRRFFAVSHTEDLPNPKLEDCQSLPDPPDDPSIFRRGIKRVGETIRESPWRAFSVVIGLSALFEYTEGNFTSYFNWSLHQIARHIPILKEAPAVVPIAELQGLTFNNLLANYQFFLIPIAIGISIALIKRREADVFCLSWFLPLLILSLAANRILISAIPAACILSGLGLLSIIEFRPPRRRTQYLKTAAVFLLMCVLLFYSSAGAYSLASGPGTRAAPNKNWYHSLIYLKENTPQDSIVLSWWDYGYWILDVAQRTPVVDNGFHGYTKEKLHDIGEAYLTTCPLKMLEVMQKYDADYLVFSKTEADAGTLNVIARCAFGEDYHLTREDFENSIYYRLLSGHLHLKGALVDVYRNTEVVIIEFRKETP